jgi:hypothetical protein
LREDGAIDWKVYLETDQEMELQWAAVKILFSSEYSSWRSQFEEGLFTQRYSRSSGWFNVYNPEATISDFLALGLSKVGGKRHPGEVLFEFQGGAFDGYPLIQSALQTQEGRALSFHSGQTKLIFKPGKTLLFSGRLYFK